jgi:hypothetical protein
LAPRPVDRVAVRSSAFKRASYAADGTQITMTIEAKYDKKSCACDSRG